MSARRKRSRPHVVEAAQGFKRTPPSVTDWLAAAKTEFPFFGLAEKMLEASDDLLIKAWRDIPDEQREVLFAFHGIGLRWLRGAEAMFAMSSRMQEAAKAAGVDFGKLEG